MKVLIPWLCVLILAIGVGWVYSTSQKKNAELAVLREERSQLEQARTELEQLKNTRTEAESDELARLRRDRDELLRLRNEVSQLRREKQQLATQVQTVQAQAQTAQEQAQALRAKPGQQAAAAPADPAAVAAFKARYGLQDLPPEEVQTKACINNLRLIDGAKAQWALEHQKRAGTLLTAADIAPYLRSNTVPVCPAGGVYTLNPVGVAPLCNIPGHALAK